MRTCYRRNCLARRTLFCFHAVSNTYSPIHDIVPKILSCINYENLFSHKSSSRSIQYLNTLLCFQSGVSLSPRTFLKRTNFVLCLAYLRCPLSCAMTSSIRSIKNLQKVYKLQYHGSLFKCICSAL